MTKQIQLPIYMYTAFIIPRSTMYQANLMKKNCDVIFWLLQTSNPKEYKNFVSSALWKIAKEKYEVTPPSELSTKMYKSPLVSSKMSFKRNF